MYEYSDIGMALSSMVVLVRGHTHFLASMATLSPAFTTIFLLAWLAFVFIVIIGLIIAVLVDAYKIVRKEMYYHNTLETQDYEMVEVLIKRLKRWMGVTKPKPVSTNWLF